MTNSSASFDNQLIRSSANQPTARDSSRPIAADKKLFFWSELTARFLDLFNQAGSAVTGHIVSSETGTVLAFLNILTTTSVLFAFVKLSSLFFIRIILYIPSNNKIKQKAPKKDHSIIKLIKYCIILLQIEKLINIICKVTFTSISILFKKIQITVGENQIMVKILSFSLEIKYVQYLCKQNKFNFENTSF